MSNIGSNIGSKIKWCFILLKLVPSCPGTHAGVKFCVTCLFYFIWFFAQFPDLFIWLYPFSLIQSNPLKVWFDCFRLFLGQIYKSFNWFYKFLVLYLPNLQICPFWFPSAPNCQSWFWCLGYLGQTCLFGLKPSRSQNLCFAVQTLISWFRPFRSNE